MPPAQKLSCSACRPPPSRACCPPLVPGSIAQQKAQLTEALDLNRSRLKANLNRQRTSTVVNSIPGTLRVLLGATIVSAFLRTIRRHFQ